MAATVGRELVEVKRRKKEWVMPGDDIAKMKPGAVVSIGRGLRQDLTRITVTRCGQYEEHRGKHLVVGDEKAYLPRNEDIIIGTVVRGGMHSSYFLDAGCGALVKLDSIAFDGASKRVKPDLKIGATVYARMIQPRCEIELEASCCSLTGVRKDWMTGESLFGELKGGLVQAIRPMFARYLLADTDELLSELGSRVAFECCVGVNGKLWLRAKTVRQTARVARCLLELQRVALPDGQTALQTPREVMNDFFPASNPAEGANKRKHDEISDEGDLEI
eukprot:TRINITY_DN22529_c0_g1_i1.p2 TRINITY_DN22529_c0_g1~~TRINITY_DN22529_c0_g1_i1.p2  ORF type:complete len:276 (+),score=110.12 TRINITY_DN22529_c0_g1_i1:82-909(+)